MQKRIFRALLTTTMKASTMLNQKYFPKLPLYSIKNKPKRKIFSKYLGNSKIFY